GRPRAACHAASRPPLLFPFIPHWLEGLRLLDCNHLVRAGVAPGWRSAVADANGDHREWRRILGPWCLAVGDDDEQIDRAALALGAPAQASANVCAAAAVQLERRGGERLSHAVHCRIAAGDYYVGAVSKLPRQTTELCNGSCQLRLLHGARGVDQEPGPGSGLVKRGHDEFAIRRLPPMRSAIRAVVAAGGSVAQRFTYDVADGGHVVPLRRQHRAPPSAPAE